MEGNNTVTRWRRCGKDRLDISDAAGSSVGWYDLADTRPGAQARKQAVQLTEAAPAGVEAPVTGLVVSVGTDDVVVKKQPDDVRVVPRIQLVRWLRRQPEALQSLAVAL